MGNRPHRLNSLRSRGKCYKHISGASFTLVHQLFIVSNLAIEQLGLVSELVARSLLRARVDFVLGLSLEGVWSTGCFVTWAVCFQAKNACKLTFIRRVIFQSSCHQLGGWCEKMCLFSKERHKTSFLFIS